MFFAVTGHPVWDAGAGASRRCLVMARVHLCEIAGRVVSGAGAGTVWGLRGW